LLPESSEGWGKATGDTSCTESERFF
jgi:hypothetical protein